MGIKDIILQRLMRKTAPLYRTMDEVPEGGLSRLFHGTPHVFPSEEGAPLGRFRDDKIGSGEGAQAFTYGHYVSGAEALAEEYRRNLTKRASRKLPPVVIDKLRAEFPDLRYISPLGGTTQLTETLGGVNVPGKLGPLSHVKQAWAKNMSGDRSRPIEKVLRELGPSIEDTVLSNQRLSPEQRAALRNIVDSHYGVKTFGGAARLGGTLPLETQRDVLAHTLNPEELGMIQSHGTMGADLNNPRVLNRNISDLASMTEEFLPSHTLWGGKVQHPTLYSGDYDKGTASIYRPFFGKPSWDKERGFSDTILEALGTQSVSPSAAGLGRNMLAQAGRYDLKDFIDSQGLGALREKVGAGDPSGRGALYRVATDNPPSNFWTLDTKIAEHPPELSESILLGLAEAASTQDVPFSMYRAAQSSGLDTYQRLLNEAKNRGLMNRTISEKLLAEGVPGAQYLRAGKREGDALQQVYDPEKFNFVFFDPEQAQIIERRK